MQGGLGRVPGRCRVVDLRKCLRYHKHIPCIFAHSGTATNAINITTRLIKGCLFAAKAAEAVITSA